MWYLEKKKGYETENLSIDGVSNKELMKSCRKYVAKASPRLLYNSGK